MSRPHFLITGGAGFIGSHLADAVLARGFDVTVLDCLLPQVHADAEKDADGWPVYMNRGARRIYGNVLDEAVFQNSLAGITHLVHLAASVGVGQSMTNIAAYTRNNTMAAAGMLQVLSRGKHKVERIAVASSMSIYGEGQYRGAVSGRDIRAPLRSEKQLARQEWELVAEGEKLDPVPTAETKPLDPASIYAINKRDHEEMFLAVGRALRIPTIALRLFNAYGSRQALGNPYTGVAAIFVARLLNGQAPLIFEDGRQRRDFVHVEDVAEAFLSVLSGNSQVWDVFNVGSGRSISIRDVAATLARLLDKDIDPQILNKFRFGDVRHCFADIAKIERAFDFRPRRDFDDGMAELIEWVGQVLKPVDRSGQSMRELASNGLIR
jgi:dTDP-L-rhamnose 4-epimerase